MSRVTNILLVCGFNDGFGNGDAYAFGCDSNADTFNKRFCEIAGSVDGTPPLKEVTEHAGGNRVMEHCLFAGAVNYCNIADVVHEYQSVKWDSPEDTQLMVMDQEEGRYKVYTLDKNGVPEVYDDPVPYARFRVSVEEASAYKGEGEDMVERMDGLIPPVSRRVGPWVLERGNNYSCETSQAEAETQLYKKGSLGRIASAIGKMR